ncbi:uncharacterized protein HaLaN_01659 [Haematococcus lacustris]|uniref:Uncharacterized protein n=1 Tax=Haematococcus lacustris TaxID=44745 RepID=A0A699YIV3_HAELA|nr:uncharacterized protein HaLaN_01659 [Haematococcus lacustris]
MSNYFPEGNDEPCLLAHIPVQPSCMAHGHVTTRVLTKHIRRNRWHVMIRSTLRSSICHAQQAKASRKPVAGAAAWSRRPIRSRRLLPEAPDPDGHSQPASQSRPDEDHLPTCFQPVPASIDVDAELRRTGGYFHAPLRATLLKSVTPTSAPTPNYRFTPDEEGGIVDMVLKKKRDIPAPFKHVRHQRLQPHLAPGSWFPLEAADPGAEAGGDSLEPFTPYSPGEDALEGEAVEALGVGLEPDTMSATISGGDGMAGAAEGQSGAQTQPHRRRGSFLAAAAEEPADVNPSGLSAELDSYLDDVLHTAKRYPDGAVGAPARSGATGRQMPSSQGREQAQPMIGSEGAEGAVALRMFGYCIGYQELFHALWDLDLLHQVQWVGSVAEADVVLHRRPQQGEKQFAYTSLRAQAARKGIPFVSINEASAEELKISLLPGRAQP